LGYFEDYNFRLTQILGKIAILGQPPGVDVIQKKQQGGKS